jgi:outer membrane immunogenic protein
MNHRLLLAAAAAPLALLWASAPAMAQVQNPYAGFYVGANLGGVWGDTSASSLAGPGVGPIVVQPVDVAAINAVNNGSSNTSGFTGGVQGGYNYVSNGVLFGIETDWGAMDVSQSASKSVNSAVLISPPLTFTTNQHVHTDWMWTLRPRLGFVSGDWLFYGTIGLAVTDVKSSFNYADTHSPGRVASMSVSDTKTGWVGGLGAAYAFDPQWSVRGEWLYADFGNVHGTAATADGFIKFDSEASVKANLFRVGLDYRF